MSAQAGHEIASSVLAGERVDVRPQALGIQVNGVHAAGRDPLGRHVLKNITDAVGERGFVGAAARLPRTTAPMAQRLCKWCAGVQLVQRSAQWYACRPFPHSGRRPGNQGGATLTSESFDTESLRTALWNQAADHAFILLDPAGTILDWAGAAPDMFGFDRSEMLGRTLSVLFTEEDQRQGLPAHELTLATSAGRSEDDRWHVRKDGALIWVTGSLVALTDGAQLIGFSKIIAERTSQRAFVETLQNRLEVAQHAATNRDVFFSRLVHEVRNCLSPIQSVVSLLEMTKTGAKLDLPLAVIRRQVVQLERMMKDVTEVARFGAGKLDMMVAL